MKSTAANDTKKTVRANTPLSEIELRHFFDFSLDLLCIAGADGYFKHINPAFTQTLGYSENYLLSKPFSEFVHPDDLEATLEEVEKLATGAVSVNFKNRYRCKDGSYKWLSWVCHPDTEAGIIYGIAHDITDRDIHERRLMEDAFRQEKERAQLYLDIAAVMLIIIDKSQRVTLINKKGCDILGYHREEVIGKNWFDNFIPGGIASQVKAVFEKLVAGEIEPSERYTNPVVTKKGEVRQITWHNTVIYDTEGAFVGTLSSGEDITERQRMESEILQISEFERQNIGQDLHDGLGSQLSGIGMISQLLARQLSKDGSPVAADVAEIAEQIKEADYMARNIARGLVTVVPEPTGLRQALHRLSENAERTYGVTCLFKEKGEVLIDDVAISTHLYRIAQEAFSNAIKHGKASKVIIQLAIERERITLSIKDNGIGMPDKLPKDRGVGLRIMQYRANVIGAQCTIEAGKPTGTVVSCKLYNKVA